MAPKSASPDLALNLGFTFISSTSWLTWLVTNGQLKLYSNKNSDFIPNICLLQSYLFQEKIPPSAQVFKPNTWPLSFIPTLQSQMYIRPTSVHCFHFSTLAQSLATFCLNSLCLSLSPAPPRALPPPIQSKSKSGCGAPYLKSTVVSYLKIKFKIPGLYRDVQGLISMIGRSCLSPWPLSASGPDSQPFLVEHTKLTSFSSPVLPA